MTAEIPEDPYEGLPTTGRRVSLRVFRDLAGLVFVVAGVLLLLGVGAAVDLRLMWALVAILLIAAGLVLGRSDERG